MLATAARQRSSRPAGSSLICGRKAPNVLPYGSLPISLSIHAIASLHALLTLELLADPAGYVPRFTSLLLALQRVPDVFEEPFRPYRFRVARAADCLICQARPTPSSVEELDVALDQALARLAHD